MTHDISYLAVHLIKIILTGTYKVLKLALTGKTTLAWHLLETK